MFLLHFFLFFFNLEDNAVGWNSGHSRFGRTKLVLLGWDSACDDVV